MNRQKQLILEELQNTCRRKITMDIGNEKLECFILKNKTGKVMIIINNDIRCDSLENQDKNRAQRVNIENLYTIFNSFRLVEVLGKYTERTIPNNIHNYKIYPGDALIIKAKGQ